MGKQKLTDFGFGTQIRKSPFFKSTLRWGAAAFSVYNHMYIPRDFGDPEQNFWNLINDAILCDVAAERQVEITGPDAAQFVQLLTGRNIEKCSIGQCKYILITNSDGGLLNDPILLKLGANHFWLSLADSDILLWAQGVSIHSGLRVKITEPDVSPLQIQGPKSIDIAIRLFGNDIVNLKYYHFFETNLEGIPLVVARTGWSSEFGYELFLRDCSRGEDLWEIIMRVGVPLGLKPGHTSTIRRIEGGMLSYQADADSSVNPFELGLGRLIDLNMKTNFIGKSALRKILDVGISRKQVGMIIEGHSIKSANTDFWPVLNQEEATVGKITSAIYSPRLKQNISLALLDINESELGTELIVITSEGARHGTVVNRPFFDPQKRIVKGI